MRRELLALRPRKLLALVLVLLIAAGVGVYINRDDKTVLKPEHPEYLSFSGNYVFTVPKNYKVDEQSVPGIQLVYAGTISGKTLDEAYGNNAISLQPISDLTHPSSKEFKAYVNNTFLPDIKKNLSTDDVKLKFAKTAGWDSARAVVASNGKPFRIIYLKNGQHPVAVVAKEETDAVKKIETTVVDVEQSDLKKEVEPIKQVLRTVVQSIKEQNAQELYRGAAPELRAKNTEAQVISALQRTTTYINEDATIGGVSYIPGGFSAVMSFSSSKNPQPKLWALDFKKIDNQWKLTAFTLPSLPATPTQPPRNN